MPRSIAFAFLGVISAFAHAADDQPARAPYIEVGDCWSFRAFNIENRGPINEYEECVTFIDRVKDVVLAVAKVKSDGREIDTSYTTEWASRTSVEGTIITNRQDQKVRRFPLRVGDTYSIEAEFRRALLGANVGKTTWNVKVVGWEDITVPAGKFRALKVEADGTTQRFDNMSKFPVRAAGWYVPAVNRSVRWWFENPDGRRDVEMTGYRLNK